MSSPSSTPSAASTAPAAPHRNPWAWIPSLYYTQGIPYVAANVMSVVMYKNLHVSNTDIAFYTSWLNFPWVIKPLWSPLVDLLGRKRSWIVTLQFILGAAFASVAWAIPGPGFFQMTLAVFWLVAFASATHDIAADGFYLIAQPPHRQAAFVGVRSTFYRLAMITGQGLLVKKAGQLSKEFGDPARAWSLVFWTLAGALLLVALWHAFLLPKPANDRPGAQQRLTAREFGETFVSFFAKPGIGIALAFILVYRLAEAQALKLVQPFLLDGRDVGGLGLDTEQLGVAYGIVGVVALLLGGIIGGYLISRFGLKRMLWPMILVMHVPIAIFLLLAVYQPENFLVICSGLAIEQFGYGFGFTAYMVYLMMIADGPHKTAHYAICTGFMALGMMLPGMAAGRIEDDIGYVKFFAWVLVCTIPSFLVITRLKIAPDFGKKAPATS